MAAIRNGRFTSTPDIQAHRRLTPKGRLFRSDGSDVACQPQHDGVLAGRHDWPSRVTPQDAGQRPYPRACSGVLLDVLGISSLKPHVVFVGEATLGNGGQGAHTGLPKGHRAREQTAGPGWHEEAAGGPSVSQDASLPRRRIRGQ
jgi:hypothetical protein